jgi:hypothetical protein
VTHAEAKQEEPTIAAPPNVDSDASTGLDIPEGSAASTDPDWNHPTALGGSVPVEVPAVVGGESSPVASPQ